VLTSASPAMLPVHIAGKLPRHCEPVRTLVWQSPA